MNEKNDKVYYKEYLRFLKPNISEVVKLDHNHIISHTTEKTKLSNELYIYTHAMIV